MRTNEERIAEMYRRRERIVRKEKRRRFIVVCGLSAAACAGILAALVLLMPRFSGVFPAGGTTENMNAGIFSGSGALGLVVTAILAFLLGITVTVFCFRLKKWQDGKERKDGR